MNSTKIFVDSINAIVKLSSEMPAPKQEWHANWDDVAITAIISFFVAFTVIMCFKEYRALIHGHIYFSLTQEEEKRKWEKEDKRRKQELEILDREYKRKQDLIVQKLNLFNELCYNLELIKEVNDGKEFQKYVKRLKGLSSVEIKRYISELNKELGIQDTETKAEDSDNANAENND